MRRGAKRSKVKVEAKRPVAPKSPQDEGVRVRDLEMRLAEAQEQQTATSEILRVISSSPTDTQPVFETMAASALRLCNAKLCTVFRFDGKLIHLVALHQVSTEGAAAYRDAYPAPPGRAGGTHRAILTRSIVHIRDIREDAEYELQALARANDFGCVLSVPMLRDGQPVGAITVGREAGRSFSDEQIELLKTFASQALIAIENVRLFNETKEGLEQQTATSEILGVISTSPTDVQPVFDAIVRNAANVCGAFDAVLALAEGDEFATPAHHGPIPRPIGKVSMQGTVTGQAIREARTVHVEDLLAADDYPIGKELAREIGYRTVLCVPLLRDGAAIGAIGIRRTEARPFTDKQIALLKTFADQAVIAIENVRLFTELQEKNRALTQAHAQVSDSLERQTATSEILRVISSSPTDVQPVFDVIIQSATRLCEAFNGTVFRFDDNLIHVAAHYNIAPEAADVVDQVFPIRPGKGTVTGRAILTRAVTHVPDIADDPEHTYPGLLEAGFRAVLSVPMLRDGRPSGAITVTRREPGAFSDDQIDLLKTFADQAVIAIENVRLFKELAEKNRALTTANAQVTESLEQQTATSEILRVISQSRTDVQPVFDTIVRNAVDLCGASQGGAYRFDGEMIHSVAHAGYTSEQLAHWRSMFPRKIDDDDGPLGRAILTRTVDLVRDVECKGGRSTGPEALANMRARGSRSVLTVPMVREGKVIGAISLAHRDVDGLSDTQVELLRTFADQAVIAIENVRLFKELEARTEDLTRSVSELRALGDVSRAISSTLDLQTVLTTIVSRAVELSDGSGGVIYEYDQVAAVFELRAAHNVDQEVMALQQSEPIRIGEGAVGRAVAIRAPVQIGDLRETQHFAARVRVRDLLIARGYLSVLAVPLLVEDEILGALVVLRQEANELGEETVELMKTFATQSALAIQNARLFREIEQKSRELEAASRHKSEFLANMSHELRTPLNAIIGFSEVLGERMFGELNEKQDEYLKDIHASGQHLLSLINDILDLSKIEAGKMELELSDFDLPMTIDNALTLVRERAGRRGIELHKSVDERLGQIQADERKIRQVLLNLLSNAIKFTPDGGRIHVEARSVNEFIEVSVTDTGVGIAPEDQEAVFEEFRQVGTADKKVEGTGLGLALSRKFIELHGGRIWVKSQVGEGSTFTFTVPVRRVNS